MTDTHTIDWRGMKVEIVGRFTPSRPAPKCSDHNSPAFSDPGDSAEVELDRAYFFDELTCRRIKMSDDFRDELLDSGEIENQLDL
jgi:hypothetical protein